jgi:MFS family permease
LRELARDSAAGISDVDGLRAWLRLAASIAFATLGASGMWAVVVVLPAIQAEFGVDRAAASLPYTLTMVGFAIGNVAIGRLIDRMGYVRPALFGTLALSAGFALAALAPSLTLFAIVQGVLIGAGASVSFGPLLADISRWFERRRGLAVALAATGSYFGGALWPIVIRSFLPGEGWRLTYIGIGIVCLVGMSGLLLLLRGEPRTVSGGRAHAGAARREIARIDLSPRAIQLLLVMAGLGCCVAMSMPQVHIVAYCTDLGYGIGNGADMLSLMLTAGIVSRVVSGHIADRIGGIRTLLIGSLLQAISLMLFIPMNGLSSLYAVSLIFGLAQGGIVPCYAIIVREYMPATEAGQRVGVVIMATIFGMALGGWLSGWLRDLTGSYEAAFANGIAWNLMNIAVMAFLLWRATRSGQGPRRTATMAGA